MAVEVCIDSVDPSALADFWCALLGYRVDDDVSAEWVHLEPGDSHLPALNLQRVPEHKRGKNRLHLDIFVNDPVEWIARCEKLGATLLRLHDDPRDWFQVMADPEGNEFCICRENVRAPREVVLDHLDAFNQHDTPRLLQGLSAAAAWRTGQDLWVGHDQLAQLFDAGLWAFEPSLAVRSLVVEGTRVAAELREEMTVDGDRRAFDIAAFFDIEHGVIRRATVYREGSADID